MVATVLAGNGNVALAGTLTAEPETPYIIEFFASSEANQGQRLVGRITRSTDGTGDVGFVEVF